MPAEINVTDKDIEYAESILLKEGESFKDKDNERINFIKNFDTIDLHAVPGSGKTTALLAKLLILERKLPFKDGSGILVISHTNTAVDEIRNKISEYCPKLFSYPNFIGTIQSFVNQFLAMPYYNYITKKKIIRIDNDIYNERIENYYKYSEYNYWLEQRSKPLEFLKKIRFNKEKKLILGINSTYKNFPLTEASGTYKTLYNMKLDFLSKGILCFDDSYFLANRYLIKCPKIKTLLQKRFSYVFVDEMQDMDSHQYEILEKIFYDNGDSKSIYQRIGDRNQAIYNGGANFKLDKIWKSREKELRITGSYRLSDNISNVVNCFALDSEDVSSISEEVINIKPHIIVYNSSNYKCEVIQKFVEIIKKFQEEGKISNNLENPIKAVSWIVKEKKEDKISLPDYCPKFNREKTSSKDDYNSLESHLINCDNDYREINKNLLNVLVKILRLENIKNESNENRFFTKRSLLWYLKNKKPEEYKILKANLYRWGYFLIKNGKSSVISDIKDYIGKFLSIFDKNIEESRDFIDRKPKIIVNNLDNAEDDFNCDKCKINDKKIEINSIHSVKGETHTATLYLESFYNRKYETDFISNMILENKTTVEEIKDIKEKISKLKNEIFELNGKRGTKTRKKKLKKKRALIDKLKRYSKMVYVGFSRPTHLLAFAVHQERYDKYLSDIDENIWEVIEVYNYYGGNKSCQQLK